MGYDDYSPWESDGFRQWNEFTEKKPEPNWRQMALSYQAVLDLVMRNQREMEDLRKQIKVLNQTIDELAVDIDEVAGDRDTWRQVAFWVSEQLVAGRMAPETPTKEKVQKYLDGFYAQIQQEGWEEDELPGHS